MLAGVGSTAEQAQAGLDLALQLLQLWCAAGKAELALAWISALIAESSGTLRAATVAEGDVTLSARHTNHSIPVPPMPCRCHSTMHSGLCGYHFIRQHARRAAGLFYIRSVCAYAAVQALEADAKAVAATGRRALLRLLLRRPAEAAVLWVTCAHVAAWQRLPDDVLDRWITLKASSARASVRALPCPQRIGYAVKALQGTLRSVFT